MKIKTGFQIVTMGDQSAEIETQKQYCYDDFDDAAEAFAQIVEEDSGQAIIKPRKLNEASVNINNVLYQIWRIDYPTN